MKRSYEFPIFAVPCSLTIISGGQTGADRAALDAAIECGITCGGWCPKGRRAEDGCIPDKYPLKEMDSENYRHRTIRNIRDSDGTVVIYFDKPSGGTRLTLDTCRKLQVPCLELDAQRLSVEESGDCIKRFIYKYGIDILNIAGPRASGHSQIYQYTYEAVREALQGL